MKDSVDQTALQQKMQTELAQKLIFDKAQSYAYAYLDEVMDRDVFPSEQGLEGLASFEEALPQGGAEAGDIIDQLHQYGAPATVATLGARYFGFVTGSVVPVGLAAKNLSTYWDQVSALEVMSPISSKLEVVVQGWLRELFDLSDKVVTGFVSGTSMANFCGMAAARYRLLANQNYNINDKGLFNAPPLRVITGRHAHSTVLKAISLLGFGKDNIEWVDVDDQGRILPDQMPTLDNTCLVILQAGNVNSGAFDPYVVICEKARAVGAWVHIDGAFGLWARAVPALKKPLTTGMQLANSWAVDGHKTLNTPYDSGIIMCDDEAALTSALHMSGSYIINGKHRDGMYYTPEMSRRARIIELWAILKYLGQEGVGTMIHTMHLRAVQFAQEIKVIEGFEVINDVAFNQVLLKCATDDLTQSVIAKVQELKTCWVGGSMWQGDKVIRISVCSWATKPSDIRMSVESFRVALGMVRG